MTQNNGFEKMNIQWFPGHMTKAQRMIEENLAMVDAVCEILDARIPYSSRNPDIDRLAGDKPRLVILNRVDLADPQMTARWRKYFESCGLAILETDAAIDSRYSADLHRFSAYHRFYGRNFRGMGYHQLTG